MHGWNLFFFLRFIILHISVLNSAQCIPRPSAVIHSQIQIWLYYFCITNKFCHLAPFSSFLLIKWCHPSIVNIFLWRKTQSLVLPYFQSSNQLFEAKHNFIIMTTPNDNFISLKIFADETSWKVPGNSQTLYQLTHLDSCLTYTFTEYS